MPEHRKNSCKGVLCLVLVIALTGSMLSGCSAVTEELSSLYDKLGIFSDSRGEIEEISLGVDVARYQGTIDWQLAAESGLDFAMIRLGYRAQVSGEIVEDANARYNLQEAARFGIPLGAYFFSTAVTPEEAREEAAWAADLVARYPITYPIAYNCEGFLDPENRQHGLTREQRTEIALAFLETIEDYGYEAMFYASRHEMQDNAQWDMTDIEKNYKVWVAQYPERPYPETEASTYTGRHQMWQYTTGGQVPGIPQDVDCNVAYFGYKELQAPKDPTPPEQVEANVEAMLNFREVDELVTAKEETNLRSIPSQGEDSLVQYVLHNGQQARRVAVCDSGWSKVIFEGETYYAVSSFLTTDLDGTGEEIETRFREVSDQVTAKEEVNLRSVPSVEDPDSRILVQLKNGDYLERTGISENGWSRLVYEGQVCYAVTRYLETPEQAAEEASSDDGTIRTQFEEVSEKVTPKDAVNLRNIPSVEDEESKVLVKIKNGDVVTRTGINRDLGWSRVEWNGQVCYCISSYLQVIE